MYNLTFTKQIYSPFFLFQRDIFYFKADLFWGVRKSAEFPKIKTLNSGWIKYQEVSLCPFSIEVHSSWGGEEGVLPEWILFILLKSSSAIEQGEKKPPDNLHSNDFQPTFMFKIVPMDLGYRNLKRR